MNAWPTPDIPFCCVLSMQSMKALAAASSSVRRLPVLPRGWRGLCLGACKVDTAAAALAGAPAEYMGSRAVKLKITVQLMLFACLYVRHALNRKWRCQAGVDKHDSTATDTHSTARDAYRMSTPLLHFHVPIYSNSQRLAPGDTRNAENTAVRAGDPAACSGRSYGIDRRVGTAFQN